MTKLALLFGINYVRTPKYALRGCINDVNNMKSFLQGEGFRVQKFTDDTNYADTTARGIIWKLFALAKETHRYPIDEVWIHFSGHGTNIEDRNGDEKDGRDECIVPADLQLIRDDTLSYLLSLFHTRTKITCMFDCCHSGTICDLPYTFQSKDRVEFKPSMRLRNHDIRMFSGCRDDQTSADAWNVRRRWQFSGAMTSCVLLVLQRGSIMFRDPLYFLESLRTQLRIKGFSQVPMLSSTQDLRKM